jgi:hypothetical protein
VPIYEYRCPDCPDVTFTAFHQGGPPSTTPACPHHETPLKRRYSFNAPEMFKPFFDVSLGEYVTSKADHISKIHQKADEQTARTGIPHQYEQIDRADMAEYAGITDEGRDDTYRREVQSGRREVKLYL